MTNCGAASESCCTSLGVTGNTYYRTYANDGDGGTGEADRATVSSFRLDKYEVTVGRFRQFVNAWNGGAGFTPAAGSGKHTHLNGGLGLVNSAAPADAGTVYEPGWVASDSSNIQPTNANLACVPPYYTWTNMPGTQEDLPINCVNWYEAYAFCIWDGGFLASESEWEYASAGGIQQREYPWGTTAPGIGNQYAMYNCYPSSSQICTGLTNIARVGTATLGAGLWGQLDLAGNVSEWNLDWFATYVDPCSDCTYLTATSGVRLSRGGEFDAISSHLVPTYRDSLAPALRSNGIGIRCARSP
jgi:formylglycine-generating enzyme required for sulfatase activity